MAMDYLIQGLPGNGVSAVVEYSKEIGRGGDYDTAFQKAFGKSRAQFYADFEGYCARGFQ